MVGGTINAITRIPTTMEKKQPRQIPRTLHTGMAKTRPILRTKNPNKKRIKTTTTPRTQTHQPPNTTPTPRKHTTIHQPTTRNQHQQTTPIPPPITPHNPQKRDMELP